MNFTPGSVQKTERNLSVVVYSKEFDMGKGEHKEQCIRFTGMCAWKVADIIIRECGLKNLDEAA